MRIQPLIQSSLFDVATWEVDSEFAVFPQGAREKGAVVAPKVPVDRVIVCGKRYLFKRSHNRYPDQFWSEVVAYRIGCLLGVEVPPAFVAYNSKTSHCAALVEWFYIDGKESFTLGGDWLQKLYPEFDRKTGSQHNLIENSELLQAISKNKSNYFVTDWHQWWVDALLFDALIGNTDRHQDNWGLIYVKENNKVKYKLSPLFDNGTSLGHERLINHILNWDDSNYERYITNKNARHHVKWEKKSNDNGPVKNGHFELLEHVLNEWPWTRAMAQAKLNFSEEDMSDALSDLIDIKSPVPLSNDRRNFILRLLVHRHRRLKALLI